MKRRKWTPEQKALVVLEGLRGRPLGELCTEHGISQAQYYQWRDRFLGNAHRVFETANLDKRTQRLELEDAKLKDLVGEFTLELKKRTAGREEARPYVKVAERNAELLERIRTLKADHPFWDYRRIWAHLCFVDEWSIGKNRVHLLMKEHCLTVRSSLLLKAKRKPTGNKPKPSRPNHWWAST